MSPATSAFLDLLRILAALIVFTNHNVQFWSPGIWKVTHPLAHSAVIIFFVLSGYVIACSTLTRHRDARKFALARLSRLYSVVLPALLLTCVAYRIGVSQNAAFYTAHSRGAELPRYLLTGVFLQSAGTFSASPASNIPFWSLSYEFWYYALFGVAIFMKGTRRAVAAVAILALMTPNILLLLPCWLVGVAAFVWRGKITLSPAAARAGFAVALAAVVLVFAFVPQTPFTVGRPGFWFSACFLSDWLASLAVGAVIVTFDKAGFGAPPAGLAGGIRWFADHTFSLYLYHYPLMILANAVLPLGGDPLRQAAMAVGVLGVCVLLSLVTEARRDAWRRLFTRWLDRIAPRREAAAP